jgi:hypothetical protein
LSFTGTGSGRTSGLYPKLFFRDRNASNELYSSSVELIEASSGSVKLKLTGREQGQKPLLKGRSSSVLTLPNEYSFELNDPQLGKLLYSGKSGLVGE